MVDQNDSTRALSTLEATRPIKPSSPAAEPVPEQPGRVLPGLNRWLQHPPTEQVEVGYGSTVVDA